MQFIRLYFMLTVLGLVFQSCTTHRNTAQTIDFKLIKKTLLGGDGFWDYLTVDADSRTLYLSHSNEVIVLNADTHALLGKIAGQHIHGVTLVSESNKGFITNGSSNTVTVFDSRTFEKKAEIPVGKEPDAALYDSFSRRLFVFCAESEEATVIDPSTMQVVGSIALGGAPEAGVTDEQGSVYVNLENRNEIAVLNAKNMKVLRRISLAPGEEPTGLALDVKNKVLFAACHNQLMIILDAKTGKMLAKLPIGERVDGLVFDPARQIAISSNGAGSLTIVREVSATEFQVAQTVITERGTRTIALDAKTHHVFTATAQYGETPAPTADNPEPRPKILPGTFVVLEYGL